MFCSRVTLTIDRPRIKFRTCFNNWPIYVSDSRDLSLTSNCNRAVYTGENKAQRGQDATKQRRNFRSSFMSKVRRVLDKEQLKTPVNH